MKIIKSSELSHDWDSRKYKNYFTCVISSEKEQEEGMKFASEKFGKGWALAKKAENWYEIWSSEYICYCIMRHLTMEEGEE